MVRRRRSLFLQRFWMLSTVLVRPIQEENYRLLQDGVPFMRSKGYRLCVGEGYRLCVDNFMNQQGFPHGKREGVPFMRRKNTSYQGALCTGGMDGCEG